MTQTPEIYHQIKRLKKTPLVLTGIILQVLKNWFKENSTQFKYDNNALETKIAIKPSYEFEPGDCQNRPGMYIRRGSYMPKGWARAGMNDYVKSGPNSEREYMILPVCPIIVFCVSRIPGEAETLAWEASNLLIALSPVIKDDFDFNVFDVEQIGEIAEIEEYKEFYTIPISIMTKFSERWSLKQNKPMLDGVLINAYTDLHAQLERGYEEGKYSDGKYE